jgi:hypothetical protein
VESFKDQFEEYHALVEGRVVAIHDLFNSIGALLSINPDWCEGSDSTKVQLMGDRRRLFLCVVAFML